MKASKRILEAQRRHQELLQKMSTMTFQVSSEEFSRFDAPDSDEDTNDFINNYLLTEEQRAQLFDRKLDLQDVLTGGFGGEDESFINTLFTDWNIKLGYNCFGY